MELPTHRVSLYNKLAATAGATQRPANPTTKECNARTETALPRDGSTSTSVPPQPGRSSVSSNRRVSYASQTNLQPVLESVDQVVKNTDLQNMQLPEPMTTDDFTRAVAVATVSALRHQQQQAYSHSPGRVRSGVEHEGTGAGGHGGHEAPSWSRTTSASVLLGCTALYAVIAGMCFDHVGNIC
jgi:Ca2+:H+ antiporter